MRGLFFGNNFFECSLTETPKTDLKAFYKKYLVLKENWSKENRAIFGKGVKESCRTSRLRVE